MLSEKNMTCLDEIGRLCRGPHNVAKPFGGLQLVLSGDFLQLPPVAGAHAFLSPAWAALLAVGETVILLTPPLHPY